MLYWTILKCSSALMYIIHKYATYSTVHIFMHHCIYTCIHILRAIQWGKVYFSKYHHILMKYAALPNNIVYEIIYFRLICPNNTTMYIRLILFIYLNVELTWLNNGLLYRVQATLFQNYIYCTDEFFSKLFYIVNF